MEEWRSGGVEEWTIKDRGPFAFQTFAGWTIAGPLYLSSVEHTEVDCHRIIVKKVVTEKPFEHHFMVPNKVKEVVTPTAPNKMFEMDFSERLVGDELGNSHVDMGIEQISDVTRGCACGGFHLTKFICNIREVLETIYEEERSN